MGQSWRICYFFLLIIIVQYQFLSTFIVYRKNIMRPFEDHTSLVSAMQKEFLF